MQLKFLYITVKGSFKVDMDQIMDVVAPNGDNLYILNDELRKYDIRTGKELLKVRPRGKPTAMCFAYMQGIPSLALAS